MYYIIFVLLILIYFYYVSQNIIFYNKETGKKIFDSPEFLKYFELYQPKEIYYKSNKQITNGSKSDLKQLYLESIRNFKYKEKLRLHYLVPKADKIMMDSFGVTIQWKFLGLDKGLDWNFFYTVDNTIIFPEEEINKMMNLEDKYILSFLTHEALHILQKGFLRQYFDQLYQEMNFVKKDIKSTLLKNAKIKEYWVTNPDGVNGEWVFATKNGFICPLLLLNESGSHSTYYVKLNKQFQIISDILPLDKCEDYQMFINKRIYQYDHPNEIFGSYLQYSVDNP